MSIRERIGEQSHTAVAGRAKRRIIGIEAVGFFRAWRRSEFSFEGDRGVGARGGERSLCGVVESEVDVVFVKTSLVRRFN